MDDCEAIMKLTKDYGYIYGALGVHPDDAENVPSDYIETLKRYILSNDKIKAVGEIGLDYHYDGYDRDRQIQIFEEQMELAKELDLPVIIHSRDAVEDTLTLLKKHRPRGIVHCFSGSAEVAKEIIKLDMYIGFTGVLTFKNAKKALKALAEVPMERLLLETDCPYMAPVPFRGKRCDSSMIAYTAEKAAEIKEMDVQQLIDITCNNGKQIYNIK
jgi:TatD DNase family protein